MNRADNEASLLFEGPDRKWGVARFYKDATSETRVGIDELGWNDGFWQFPSRALSQGDRMVASEAETVTVPDHRVYHASSTRTAPEFTVPEEQPLDISITYERFEGETTLSNDELWLVEPLEYDSERDYWTVVAVYALHRDDGDPLVSTIQIPNHRVYHVDGHEF
ncbi:hypothetical protein SAMN04487950_4001 [Halogranum rubrum]|uniref:Uncharacterized protein n=1 Tax=Halogranum rubrum TaxID=553466 RepID=A0A1I4I871_9EURY|nr:hypothetical protein [Halogranum rubrum]SFL49916.1 hypothetical protein SAMN04487950_4001 [Halogranum rubrum]